MYSSIFYLSSVNWQVKIQDITWYRVSDVITAWGLYTAAAATFRNVETFHYDLVDITRQALANIAPVFYNKVQMAYRYV